MQCGTQIRVAAATRVRRVATIIFIVTGFAIGADDTNAVPLPNGYDAPLSSPLVVPTPPVATPTPLKPTAPVASNTQAQAQAQAQAPGNASIPTTLSAGRTPATFSVNHSGVATYSIPIWTPPSVGADRFKLALNYSSRSPDGVTGVGWGIFGMSAITRCNRTWAQDGFAQGITLTTADRLCMDGQQLKVVSGSPSTPAQGGTTFATEIETFSQITAAGSSGSAPTSLTVKTKNGLIYDYGLTADSQIMGGPSGPIRAWALSQIRDRVGNTIKFSYYNDAGPGSGYTNGSYRIKEIDYPYTASGQGPFYSVTFGYGARASGTNIPSGYIAGALVQEPNQLNTISIQNYGSPTPTKAYYLTYVTNSVSSRLELQQIQECSASNCLPATTVAYQAGAQGWSGSLYSAGAQSSTQASPIAIDLNGDGLSDILYPVTVTSSTVHWWIVFSTGSAGSGFSSPVDTGITTGNFPAIITGAFSGKGQNQFLVGQSGYWYVYTCGTTGCTHANTNVSVNGEMFAADYDGDGLPDLVSAVGNSVLVRRNITSTGGAVTFASTATTVWTASSAVTLAPNNSGIFYAADFNADGRADVLATTTFNTGFAIITQWNVLLSNGFSAAPTVVTLRGSSYNFPMAGDWNGDGCTDIISLGGVYVSNCAGGFTTIGSPWAGNPISTIALDWDGDGNTDLLYDNNGTWYVARSTGTGMAAGVPAGLSAPTSTSWFPLDQNGDGLADLAYVDGNSGNAIKFTVHAGASTPPDLATSFTDGFAMNQSPTYVPIATGNYYKNSDAVFPEQDFQGPLYVVNQFTASDGTGSTYQNQFVYYYARVQTQGRGFEGFYARRTYDTRNGLYTFDYSGRQFPFTSMLFQHELLQGDASTYIYYGNGTLTNQVSGGSGYEQRLFPYFSATVRQDYEFGGTLNGTITKITSTSATYGDTFGNATEVDITITDKDSTSPYYNLSWGSVIKNTFLNDNSSAWCLGLPTVTTAQNSAPTQTTQTRTYNFAPDSNHTFCREEQQVIEPNTASLTVTTNLGFDACGNVDSVAIIGHNPDGSVMPTPRTATLGYGTRCQLPETVQNALGQTTSIAYLYDFGVPTQATDPNLIAVKWAYDDFGRKNKETRPDQTYSTLTYYYCNSPPCWGVNDLRFSAFRNDYGTDGTLAYSEGFYSDGLNRVRYDQTTHAFGTLVDDEIDGYDSLGRTIWRYQPVSSSSNGYFAFAYDAISRPTGAKLYQTSGALDRTVSWAYAGRTTTITDPLNNNTNRIADVIGRLRQVRDPAPGGTTYYDFDAFGNLNKITDTIGAVSTATYNLRGFKTQMVDADAGTWNFTGDSLNELVSWTDAKNQSFGAAYDALARLMSRTEPEGTSTWTWGNSASAHNIGSLQSESGYGYSESLSYDGIGRLQTRAILTDQSYQYDYAYNGVNGAIDTITYPTSTASTRFKIQYGYSYMYPTQITDVTVPGSPATLWTLTSANDYSSPTAESLGASAVSVQSGYKAWTDELTSIQSAAGTTSRQNLAYAWDLNGNLHERQDLNQNPNLSEIFAYDALNRLASSTLNGNQNFSASYVNGSGVDQAGNIMNRSDVGSYAYGDPQHAHGVTGAGNYSYTYDKNGNTATRNNISLTWASFNLPTVLSASAGGSTYTSTFSYGPDHQRYHQAATYSNGTENTSYAGGLLEMVWGTDTKGLNLYRHYVPTPSGLTIIVSRNSDGSTTTTYALSDHLGSSDALLGSSGNLLVQESFAPFGQRRGSTWTGVPSSGDYAAIAGTTRRGFTYQEELDNISLIHMNGRVYDPNVGRFLSVDPLIGSVADSQSVNPYTYVGNRPLSAIDPTGYDDLATVTVTGSSGSDSGLVPGLENLLGNAWDAIFNGRNCPCNPPPSAAVNPNSAQSGIGVVPATQMPDGSIRFGSEVPGAELLWEGVMQLSGTPAVGSELFQGVVTSVDVPPPGSGELTTVTVTGTRGGADAGAAFVPAPKFSWTGAASITPAKAIGDFLANFGPKSWGGYGTNLLTGTEVSPREMQDAVPNIVLWAAPGGRLTAARGVIGATGRIGEAALKNLGGESQVFFRTSQGARFVDQLANGIAHESKVGYQTLNAQARSQIAKDVELTQSGQVGGVAWHFFQSPVTGLGGPSGPLADALRNAGINVITP
jgi:RHS repeat-associated protein